MSSSARWDPRVPARHQAAAGAPRLCLAPASAGDRVARGAEHRARRRVRHRSSSMRGLAPQGGERARGPQGEQDRAQRIDAELSGDRDQRLDNLARLASTDGARLRARRKSPRRNKPAARCRASRRRRGRPRNPAAPKAPGGPRRRLAFVERDHADARRQHRGKPSRCRRDLAHVERGREIAPRRQW